MDAPAILDTTIDSVLFGLAESKPDRLAVRVDGYEATFGDLRHQAERFGRWLRSAGVEAGDRVALWLPNGLPWVIAHIAIAAAGAVSVPISTRLVPREVDFIIRHSESKVLVTADRFLRRRYADEARELGARLGADGVEVEIVRVEPVGGELPGGPTTGRLPGANPRDPAVIQYTSGTTGSPKGCLLSHCAWTNNARLSALVAGISPDDVIFCPSPFFHLFGSLTGLMGAFSTGASFVTSPTFDARAAATAISAAGVTRLVAVPTMWLDLMSITSPGELQTVRAGVWGGAAFPRPLLQRAMDRGDGFGWDLQAIYGMTEAPTLTQIRPGDSLDSKLDTVGRATPAVEVRTVDPATGTATDAVGEIWARGYNQMMGYFKDPAATDDRFSGEWIRSGDLGVIDGHGFLRVVGRLTDLIITGGANVYPAEVESVIVELSGVRQAAVVGREDDRLGEVPVAWVAIQDSLLSEAAIIAHCRESLAGHKVPRQVFIVPEIPITASGKIHKSFLRDLANRKGR